MNTNSLYALNRRTLNRSRKEWEELSSFSATTLSALPGTRECIPSVDGFLSRLRILTLNIVRTADGYWTRTLQEHAVAYANNTDEARYVETGFWDAGVAPINNVPDPRRSPDREYCKRLPAHIWGRWADVQHMEDSILRVARKKQEPFPEEDSVVPFELFFKDGVLYEKVPKHAFCRTIRNTAAKEVWAGDPFFIDISDPDKHKELQEVLRFILGRKAAGDREHYDFVVNRMGGVLTNYQCDHSADLWNAFAFPKTAIATRLPEIRVSRVTAEADAVEADPVLLDLMGTS